MSDDYHPSWTPNVQATTDKWYLDRRNWAIAIARQDIRAMLGDTSECSRELV